MPVVGFKVAACGPGLKLDEVEGLNFLKIQKPKENKIKNKTKQKKEKNSKVIHIGSNSESVKIILLGKKLSLQLMLVVL
jgi:hypothetical protein